MVVNVFGQVGFLAMPGVKSSKFKRRVQMPAAQSIGKMRRQQQTRRIVERQSKGE